MADIATKDTEIDVNVDKGPKILNYLGAPKEKPKIISGTHVTKKRKSRSRRRMKKAMGGSADVVRRHKLMCVA